MQIEAIADDLGVNCYLKNAPSMRLQQLILPSGRYLIEGGLLSPKKIYRILERRGEECTVEEIDSPDVRLEIHTHDFD